MATYPGDYRVFTTKRDFTQTIFESHVNDIQDELYATQVVLGMNPHIALEDPAALRRIDHHDHGPVTGPAVVDRHYQDHGTVAERIQNYMRGLQMPYYVGSVIS